MATIDLEFVRIATLYRAYIKIDAGSKVKTADTRLCFQRPCALVRHNANYIAYEQIPGCPLCSIRLIHEFSRARPTDLYITGLEMQI